MGTCEETLPPPLQTDNETNLMSQSNGTHKYTHSGDDRGEGDSLAQMLDTVHLEEESTEIGATVDDGDVVLDDDDDDDDGYGGVPDGDITHPYPIRPDAMDCLFYLKTGSCKFGPICRFNHPLGKGGQFSGDKKKEVQAFYQDVGKIECKYYLSPGGCKYGDVCRYNHLKAKVGTKAPELNFLGLPIRLGEKDCDFYRRNGTCGYGEHCKFHHPDPAEVKQSDPDISSVVNGQSVRGIQYPETYMTKFGPLQPPGAPESSVTSLSNYGDAGNCLSYMPAVNPFSQGMPPSLGWSQYQKKNDERRQIMGSINRLNLISANQATSQPDSSGKFYSNGAATSPLKKAEFIPYHQQQLHAEDFPERPGVLECDYFMRTGNCKYKSACRFHHPRSRLTNSEIDAKQNFYKGANSFVHQQYQELSEEFPERPDQRECEYFMKTGDCKFKSACRYHHPKSHIPNSVNSAVRVNGLPSRHAPNPTPEHSWTLDKSANDVKRKGFKYHQQLQAEEFPERPGEPECEYYMKTGNCKYKSACRFDHPRNRMSTLSECTLSAKGFPLRPGSKICRHYEQHGTCSYGRSCLFDHPDGYNSSAHSSAAYASETPASSYPDAPPAESAGFVPAAESSTGNDYVIVPAAESSTCNDYVSDGWGDGWVM